MTMRAAPPARAHARAAHPQDPQLYESPKLYRGSGAGSTERTRGQHSLLLDAVTELLLSAPAPAQAGVGAQHQQARQQQGAAGGAKDQVGPPLGGGVTPGLGCTPAHPDEPPCRSLPCPTRLLSQTSARLPPPALGPAYLPPPCRPAGPQLLLRLLRKLMSLQPSMEGTERLAMEVALQLLQAVRATGGGSVGGCAGMGARAGA